MLNEHNAANSGERADALALRSDWQAVGDDLRWAMRAFEAEHASELAGLDRSPGRPAETVQADATATAQLHPDRFPPAAALARYEKVIPGAADQIMTMAEREGARRQNAEMAAITADGRRGLAWLGFWLVIALAGLALAGALTMLGQPVLGFAVAMLTIVAFAGALAYGMRRRTKYEVGAL